MNKYVLSKTVRVSDPAIWYGQSEITVEMWHDDFLDDGAVRIMFSSIDDLLIYRDFNEWELDANWRWCKTWLWNTIPEEVSCEWLYEHGYAPF